MSGSITEKGKKIWKNLMQGDSPMAIGTEGKADCPRCGKEIDFSQYSNQRGDEINAGNPFSCPHCSQLLLRWEPDEAVSNCHGCNVKFFSFRSWNDIVRKHHCRMCGKIFCSECLKLCRVPGFGWEVHGNWIKLKLCQPCDNKNLDDQKKREEAKAAEEAAAEADAPPADEPAAAEASNSSVYAADAMAELKLEEKEEQPVKRQSRLNRPKPTSLFDDDISFINPSSSSAASKKKSPKKAKAKQLDMFEGGESSPAKESLFD